MLVRTLEDVAEVILTLSGAQYIGYDTESDSLERRTAKPVGFSVSDGDCAWYVPISHAGVNASSEAVDALLAWLADRPLCFHNYLFDAMLTMNFGTLLTPTHDTMIAAQVHGEVSAALKELAGTHLGLKMATYEEVAKGRLMSQLTPEEAHVYAGEDARVTVLLIDKLVAPDGSALRDIYNLEIDVLPLTLAMERRGIPADKDWMLLESKRLQAKMPLVELLFFLSVAERLKLPLAAIKKAYPINSTKKVEELLYDRLRLKATKKTKGGARSSDEESLLPYRATDDAVNALLTWRELRTRSNSFYTRIAEAVQPDGRLYPTWKQASQAAGRMSTSDPGIHNWPASGAWEMRLPDGRKVAFTSEQRRGVVAPEGYQLIHADYSQIEYRIIAGMTKARHLLDRYEAGDDLHVYTYAFCFEVAPDQVTAAQRRVGKTINFSLVYGLGTDRLFLKLEGRFSKEDARRIHTRYLDMLPEVVVYREQIGHEVLDTHYVESLFGRRVRIEEFDRNDKVGGMRAAFNNRIQSTAADILKFAMRDTTGLTASSQSHLLMTHHDALLWAVPLSYPADRFARELKAAVEYSVPEYPVFEMSVAAGPSWNAVEKIS